MIPYFYKVYSVRLNHNRESPALKGTIPDAAPKRASKEPELVSKKAMRTDCIVGFRHSWKPVEDNFVDIGVSESGLWQAGREGVLRILTPKDGKSEFIVYRDKTLVCVKSVLGHPAIYPLHDVDFNPPAEAVLMDLDGTTINSERFWISILEKTIAWLTERSSFSFNPEERPFVSGHSVSEHLQYCLGKYCPEHGIEEARATYLEIARKELHEIERGRGNTEAFRPALGLKEFLGRLKEEGIKVGLVSSGLHEKAWPEVLAAFRVMKAGNPLDYYDAIVTAGQVIQKGQAGTLGELAAKPHPWLYAEALRVGLGIPRERYDRVVGIEDSSAGVLSIRLAGFPAIGLDGGNIGASGADALVHGKYKNLEEALLFILGTNRKPK